jgi:hypothetical protein
MPLTTTANRKDYAGNGVTTVFSFPYKFFDEDDLTVIEVDGASGAETVKTITTHYTVSGAGDANGGTVTMLSPPASGKKLVILREVELTQEVDLVDNDPLPSASLEEMVERTLMGVQQQQETLSRVATMPKSVPATVFDPALPTGLAGVSNRALITNDDGDGFDVGPTADEISAAQTYATNAATSATAAASSASAASTAETAAEAAQVAAEAALASLTLPAIVGKATNMLRVKADESGYEHRTVAEVRGDIGAAALTGGNTFTGTQVWAKGADVASAAALPLIADGNYFDVTGGVTVTSMAPLGVGAHIKLHFDAALTLTHHVTDLVLPGAANITTAAGDEAEFVEYATGDWRCVSYMRASGQGVNYAVETRNPASGTSFDFTVPVWAKEIRLCFYNVSTNGTASMRIQLGDAGGVEGTGYLGSTSVFTAAAVTTTAFSGGFDFNMMAAAGMVQGHVTLANIGGNDWAISGSLSRADTAIAATIGGVKPTTQQLTTIRVITSNGTDTYDSGIVVAIYR